MKENKRRLFQIIEIVVKIVVICVLDMFLYKVYKLIGYGEFSLYIEGSMRGVIILQTIFINELIVETSFKDLKDKSNSSQNALKVLILGIVVNIALALIGVCFIDDDYAGFKYWCFTAILVLVVRKIGKVKLQCNKAMQ